MHFKYGIKLYALEKDLVYLDAAKELIEEGVYDYIEIFTPLDTADDLLRRFADVSVPLLLHAPHESAGLDLSKVEDRSANQRHIENALRRADIIRSPGIIFHSGHTPHYEETIRQLSPFVGDDRLIVENNCCQPQKGYHGTLPEYTQAINEALGCGFCFDIAHAIASANFMGVDRLAHAKKFAELGPTMIHISDKNLFNTDDSHLSIGDGNLPHGEILALIEKGLPATLETKKKQSARLDSNRADIEILESLIKS